MQEKTQAAVILMAKTLTIGVDIGGTKIRSGLVSSSGKILKTFTQPTEAAKGGRAVLRNIERSITEVWDRNARAVGLGIAGIVDHRRGVYLQGPNLPKDFRRVPLARLIAKKFRLKASVDNDVHCFTLAEAKLGSGKGFSHVVGVTLGTGIGGGVVIDGTLYRGRDNAAGELGHMIVEMSSTALCGCGRQGHFEAFASGSGVSRAYEKATGRRLDALAVEKAATAGDKDAVAVLAVMEDALAAGLANIVHVLNPDIIVVGGGLSAVKGMWSDVRRKMKGLIIFPELKNTPIERSKLGGTANVLGAAMMAGEK